MEDLWVNIPDSSRSAWRLPALVPEVVASHHPAHRYIYGYRGLKNYVSTNPGIQASESWGDESKPATRPELISRRVLRLLILSEADASYRYQFSCLPGKMAFGL